MDAILATNQSHIISQICGDRQIIPWLSDKNFALDLQVFKEFTTDKILWCTWGTYQSLPFSVKSDLTRSFKILSRTYTGLKLEHSCQDQVVFYSFQDLQNHIGKLSSRHVLIGGPQAYGRFIPQCKTVIHTTVNAKPNGDTFVTVTPVWEQKPISHCAHVSEYLEIKVYTETLLNLKVALKECGLDE